MLVALEPVEAVRHLPLLGPRTTAVISTKTIPPITLSSMPGARYPTAKQVLRTLGAQVETVVALNGTELADELGNPAVLSAVMIGAAWATGKLPLRKKHLMAAIEQVVPSRFLDLNRAAFEAGMKAVRS
jgi:indolepyruvate ferredoxin oxidoreductase beta subunit